MELIKNLDSKPKEEEVSFYEQLCAIDIIDPVVSLFLEGKIKTGLDGKLRLHDVIALNRTWTIAKMCPERKCAKWLSIYHQVYKILSPPCKQCWKIVYHPYNIRELIEVQKFQTQLDLPSKCGIEQRDFTSGLGAYRAFWYCPFTEGLRGGRRHFEKIKLELEEHFGESFIREKIKSDHLYLKRGCTELERDFGPSDKWDEIDHSRKFTLLETVWEDPGNVDREFSPLIYTNYKRWIEYAVAHGDSTVLTYVKGKALGVPSVKYHDSAHREDDFTPGQ